MSTDNAAAYPLIDHHCHGLMPANVTRQAFERMISESFVDAPAGTTHFDAPVGLALRATCPQILDLEPFCTPEDYLARRTALGATEVNQRFLAAAGCKALFVDTGHRGDEITSPADLTALSGIAAYEVIRLERIAEDVVHAGTTAAGYARAFGERLENACEYAVGLKSIVAYRGGFGFDAARPTAPEVEAAAGDWLRECESGRIFLRNETIIRHGLWAGADLAVERGFPIQFHTGFGDRDAVIHRANPSLMSDFLTEMDERGVNVTLLHCFPFHRESGYLAEVFPNVYFDVGVIINYTGPRAATVIGEALELAPFTKQLYSSDAWGIAEFYYMGALLFRRGLKRNLDAWIGDGMCSAEEADRITRMIATENARRIYPLPT